MKMHFAVLGITITALFLGLFTFSSFASTASAAQACSRADMTKCSSTNCSGVGGIWSPAGGGVNYAHCAPSPSECNYSNPLNCVNKKDCLAAGLLFGNPYAPGHPDSCYKPANSGDYGPSTSNDITPVEGPCGKATFFGLVPWYQYLDMQTGADGSCEVANFNALGNGANSGILLIVLAIVDDLLRIAGMAAVAFVIVAGFKIMTAQGEPEKVASGRKTLAFALVGLAIAILAVAAVSFIGKALGS